MHVTTVGAGKKMSTCGVAKLYKGKKELGLCFDTPNSIACAMKHSGAKRALNALGEVVKIDRDRLLAAGWMNIESSGYQSA